MLYFKVNVDITFSLKVFSEKFVSAEKFVCWLSDEYLTSYLILNYKMNVVIYHVVDSSCFD